MHQLFLLAGTFLLLSSSVLAKEISVKSSIKDVTVFLAGAEIHRTARANVPSGRHTLVFTNLSPLLNPQSIQIRGTGSYTILSVTKKSNYYRPQDRSPRYQAIQDSIEWLKGEIYLSQQMRSVYNQEKDMILSNKRVMLEKTNTSVSDVETMANFYRKRLREILNLTIKESKKENKLNLKKSRLEGELRQLGNQNKTTGEVWVEIDNPGTVSSSLHLTYTVNNARWIPHYSVRVDGKKEKISIDRNANIYQQTGEDWNRVNLTLSTSNPQLSTRIPELRPWRLGFVQYGRKMKANQGYRYENSYSTAGAVAEDAPLIEKDEAKTLAWSTDISESQIDLRFEVGVKSDVPADGLAHKVNVQNLDAEAEFIYTTVPKQKQDAYLLCNLMAWEKLQLMSAQADIFFNDTYVGQSQINTLNTGEKLGISMGIDKQVTVQRKRLEDYCEVKILGSNKRETMAIQVAVKNTKQKAIKLQIKEQIPVAATDQITVELLEKEGAVYDEKTGYLTWNVELQPGEQKIVSFKYQVKYPKDQKVSL